MSLILDDEIEDFEPLDFMQSFSDVEAEEISKMIIAVSPTTISKQGGVNTDIQSARSWFSADSDSSSSTMESISRDQSLAKGQNQVSNTSFQPSFVNAYLIVDPITQKVVMPEQTLTCTVNGKIMSAICGPKILEFSQEHILSLSQNAMPLPSLKEENTQPPSTIVKATSETLASKIIPETPSFSSLGTFKTKNVSNSTSKPSAAYLASKLTSQDIAPLTTIYDKSQKFETASACRPSTDAYDISFSGDLLPPPPQLPVLKALTAYNFFFRDERDALVQGRKAEGFDWSLEKRYLLLSNHWYRDRNVKRRHRKTEGNIDFSTLSKIISRRWKNLPKDGKKFYRDIASRDLERFEDETNFFRLSERTAT